MERRENARFREVMTDPNLQFNDEMKNWVFNTNSNTLDVVIRGRLVGSTVISNIKSDEIRKYYINKYFSEYCQYDPVKALEKYLSKDIKLSDFDIDQCILNKEDKTITINNIAINIINIESEEIKKYFIKQIPECFLTECSDLKLSDFDIDQCILNKENKTITINNISINIINIESEEIKKYFIMKIPECFLIECSDLKLSDFDTDKIRMYSSSAYINNLQISNINNIKSEEIRLFCENIKKLQDAIKHIYFDPSNYNIVIKSYNNKYSSFEIQNGIILSLQDIKSLKAKKLFFDYLNINDRRIFLIKHLDWDYINLINYKQKSYILKYIFAKVKKVTIQKSDFKSDLECLKEYPNLLVELLELCINTNNEENLKGLLENKETIIPISEYKKLQNLTQNLRLFNLTAILIEYEYLDKINTYDDCEEVNISEVDNNKLKNDLWS